MRLAWLSLLIAPALLAAQPDLPPLPRELKVGISPERAKELLGPPVRVSRQVLLLRSLEQWHYGPPHQVRLTFEQPRGQKPVLTSYRRSVSPR